MSVLAPAHRASLVLELAIVLPMAERLGIIRELAESLLPADRRDAVATEGQPRCVRHSYLGGTKPGDGRVCQRCGHVDKGEE